MIFDVNSLFPDKAVPLSAYLVHSTAVECISLFLICRVSDLDMIFGCNSVGILHEFCSGIQKQFQTNQNCPSWYRIKFDYKNKCVCPFSTLWETCLPGHLCGQSCSGYRAAEARSHHAWILEFLKPGKVEGHLASQAHHRDTRWIGDNPATEERNRNTEQMNGHTNHQRYNCTLDETTS